MLATSPQKNLPLNLIENPTPKSSVKIEIIEIHPHTPAKNPIKKSPNPKDPLWVDLLQVTPKKRSVAFIGSVENKMRKLLIWELGEEANTVEIPDDNENPKCSTPVGRRSTRLAMSASKGSGSSKKSKDSEEKCVSGSQESKGKRW